MNFFGIPITRFVYTALITCCFLIPFFYTLIHRNFLKKYRYHLFDPTVILAGIPFILFDIFAVSQGYWYFNGKYTTPLRIINLPAEEYLFFLLIPQSCLLLWVALKRYSGKCTLWSDIRHHFHKKHTL